MLASMKDYLEKCKEAYYKGSPIISDVIYDILESKFSVKNVGYSVTEDRVPHLYPMYSLEKFYTGDNNIPVFSNSCETTKLDGAAIELIYADRLLRQVSTRGDGIFGKDITNNIIGTELIPSRITSKDVIQITGEVVAPRDIDNPRNYAAGSLNLKSRDEFIERLQDLTFVAYGISPNKCSTYTANMRYLHNEGFNTVIHSDLSIFPTDGIVFRENNNKLFSNLGYTSSFPRGAYALKDKSDIPVLETELLQVIWQVASSGKVTPVANFTTINIDGANISKATLHNAGFIEDMDLCIGDTILVTRSGGVIPSVIGKL